MITPKAFFEDLSQSTPRIVPAPQVPIKIGVADIMAARLLLWLGDQLPEDATVGDFEDVLDAAKWWHVFFVLANTAAKEKMDGDSK